MPSQTMMTCPGPAVEHCVCCGRRSPAQKGGEWWNASGQQVSGVTCYDHVESGDPETHRHDEVCDLL
ncbi:hypothetical protein ACIBG4_40820 [Nonomuraea sp. NPDC050383]|uniref:hypothetical protein n=1 Tax=Nonomuraea sp. NPDC050383 TaxID=3364362 RepID=UPI00378BD096